MIVCVLFPRFELVIAAGGRSKLAEGPAALAPEPGREQMIGEVSAAAEAFGVRPGMRLGEALARCPRLALIPPDPAGVAEAWEKVLQRLEGLGAAVESSERAGSAFFEARSVKALHGGSADGVVAAVRRALPGPVRIGAGPTRFCALAAASGARARKPEIVGSGEEAARRYLKGAPVELLRLRSATALLPEALERLGVKTLGEFAALSRADVVDRFGVAGETAHELAMGRDTKLVPRSASEPLEESLELPESGSGSQLERAMGLLVDRLLARRDRKGRSLRVVVIAAKLVEGGTWRERIVFREPTLDPARMRMVLGLRLGLLPAPAEVLKLAVERFGPPSSDQRPLMDDAAEVRRARLAEAVRQTRATAGPDAALRVLEVDPDSRVPERRAVLAPFQ